MVSDDISYDERRELYRAGIAEANIPALLSVLAQLTGDRRWLEPPYRPVRAGGLDDNDSGGLSIEIQDEVRDAALRVILDWEDKGRPQGAAPSGETLVEMLSISMDEPIPSEYGPMLREDLLANSAGVDVASDTESTGEGASDAGVLARSGKTAVIIGAGIAGILAAHTFDKAGMPYTILDKGHSVGGVWRDNRYPGVGVDTPSYLYSFAENPHDWENYFALGGQVHDYLRVVADRLGIANRVHFGETVNEARYDEASAQWIVRSVDESGATHEYRADILVSAVGAFVIPSVPDFPGIESFTGDVFHAANWPEGDNDPVRGKRVAVVGGGATAMQVVPAITPLVSQLTVVQRSPQWVAPFPKFAARIPESVRFLLSQQPHYRWWYRARLQWTFNDRLWESLQKDPEWPHPERSLNAVNDGHRRFFTKYLLTQLEGRDDLVEKSLPSYPPYGKRMLMDNGWFAAIRQPHVELIRGSVARFEADGIVTTDGEHRAVDTVIMATGFQVARLLGTYTVIGRDGANLRDEWNDDDPRAYLGTTVPKFPNFFVLYGPNTQAGHGGSLIQTLEAQIGYVIRLLEEAARTGVRSFEVRQEAYAAHNARVDAGHNNMVWTHPGTSSYYRNRHGRVVAPSPFRNIDYWYMLRNSSLADYVVERESVVSEVATQ